MFAHVQFFSHFQLFAIPWTEAHQAPLFMEISRQDHWIGWPFPTLIVMHENIQFSKHHLSERPFSSIAWSWNPYENHLATEVRISGLSLTPLVSMSVPKPAPHCFDSCTFIMFSNWVVNLPNSSISRLFLSVLSPLKFHTFLLRLPLGLVRTALILYYVVLGSIANLTILSSNAPAWDVYLFKCFFQQCSVVLL